MEFNILGITVIDLWGLIVDEMISAAVGEVPYVGSIISCIYGFISKCVVLGWNCIKIPTSCIFGLTEIDRSFYKGMEEFPLVLYDLIRHLFGKG